MTLRALWQLLVYMIKGDRMLDTQERKRVGI
jgi:hypothetical protein